MEFLGIGPMEILVILLVALLLLGPKDMAKTGRTIGKTLRKVVGSQQWRAVNQTSRELRNLPNRLMREAGLEEMQNDMSEINRAARDIQQSWGTNTILPPHWEDLSNTAEDATSQPAQDTPAAPDGSPEPPAAQDDGLSAWTNPPK